MSVLLGLMGVTVVVVDAGTLLVHIHVTVMLGTRLSMADLVQVAAVFTHVMWCSPYGSFHLQTSMSVLVQALTAVLRFAPTPWAHTLAAAMRATT